MHVYNGRGDAAEAIRWPIAILSRLTTTSSSWLRKTIRIARSSAIHRRRTSTCLEQAGAAHFIAFGSHEGRTTTFDGLSYIANYTDLMHGFGANNDAGAAHYISNGFDEGRSTRFDVAGYLSAHPYLQGRYATADQFLAAYIDTYVTTGHFLT